MRLRTFFSLGSLAGSALACQSPAASEPAAASGAPAMSPASPAAPPAAAPRYDVRGLFDPGLGGIIAYALKVPHGWLMQQSFTRQWDRALPSNKIFLGLTSPDQRQAITILPEVDYHYDTSPAAQQLTAFKAQRGIADPTERQPLLPLDYLKQVVLPLLGQQPATRLRVTAEHGEQPKMIGQNLQEASGYVEGVLPSGRKVRVNVGIRLLVMNLNGSASGNWAVFTDISETTGDLAALVATSAAVSKSMTVNPAWQRQDNALKEHGTQLNIQQSQAAIQQTIASNQANQARIMQQFHQNVATQQAQRSALNGAFQSRQRASSQVASAYADFMGDNTLYQNPATGERVKVQGSLGNVYQDARGTVLNSNQPLAGSHVNWQTLQQVELKNY